MPDTRTKDADLAAIRARCELNYTVAGHPKFAGNQIVMAALATAKASEAAFLAAVAEADAARGFRIWSAYRHCREACAAADSAHAALRAAIEIAEEPKMSDADMKAELEALRAENSKLTADAQAKLSLKKQECDTPSNNLLDSEGNASTYFRGKPNTKAILKEKAGVAAVCIINSLDKPLELATRVARLHVGVEEARQALVETAAFLLSYIDQPAFLYLGAENRTVFMNALEGPIYYELRERGIELTAFRKLLNERYNEYGKSCGCATKAPMTPSGGNSGRLLRSL
jgi:hypothetical protein